MSSETVYYTLKVCLETLLSKVTGSTWRSITRHAVSTYKSYIQGFTNTWAVFVSNNTSPFSATPESF